jgi:hypothetical protein
LKHCFGPGPVEGERFSDVEDIAVLLARDLLADGDDAVRTISFGHRHSMGSLNELEMNLELFAPLSFAIITTAVCGRLAALAAPTVRGVRPGAIGIGLAAAAGLSSSGPVPSTYLLARAALGDHA